MAKYYFVECIVKNLEGSPIHMENVSKEDKI